MTRGDVTLKLAETEPRTGEWSAIERYADLLTELERMLSDPEIGAACL